MHAEVTNAYFVRSARSDAMDFQVDVHPACRTIQNVEQPIASQVVRRRGVMWRAWNNRTAICSIAFTNSNSD